MSAIARIEDLDDTSFDPYIADEVMFGDDPDPYSRIAVARAKAPVIPGTYRELMGLPLEPLDPDQPKFTVLSYAAIDQILNDPQTFSNHSFDPTLGVVFGPILTVMDPPEHTGYRRVLQQAFRPSIVQSWGESIVEPVVDELMAGFLDRGRVELIGEFTRPYPFHVLYRMLGLPIEDIETFYRLTIAQLVTSFAMDNAKEAAAKLGNYFRSMLAERRANPGSDMVSALAALEIDGEPFPEEVTVAFLRQLMSAGGETTFRSASVLFTGLLTHPEQLEAIRAERSLIPAAIEEALRWDGPVVTSTRLTTREVVLDGVQLPAGAHLDVLFGSANHDPSVVERPDAFDIFRPKQRHFAFAFGIHNCIGQGLARLEMTRSLNAFLDRLPNARLDPEKPEPIIRGAVMRIPRELHVLFDR